MRTINNMLETVQKINLDETIVETMVKTEDDFVALQKDQLQYGLNAAGELIGQYRSEAYAEEKHRMNSKAGFGNVDLKLTGSFYEGITTHISSEGFLVESSDEKAPDLEKKYGDPFGLETERKQTYAQTAHPVLIAEVAKQL